MTASQRSTSTWIGSPLATINLAKRMAVGGHGSGGAMHLRGPGRVEHDFIRFSWARRAKTEGAIALNGSAALAPDGATLYQPGTMPEGCLQIHLSSAESAIQPAQREQLDVIGNDGFGFDPTVTSTDGDSERSDFSTI